MFYEDVQGWDFECVLEMSWGSAWGVVVAYRQYSLDLCLPHIWPVKGLQLAHWDGLPGSQYIISPPHMPCSSVQVNLLFAMTKPIDAVLDIMQPRLDVCGLAQLAENPGRTPASSHVHEEQKRAHESNM
jgi:hypothetical protein